MPSENISVTWETMVQEFQTPSLRDKREIRNYLDSINPAITPKLPWPDFENKASIPKQLLSEDARIGIRNALTASMLEINEIYRVSATEIFFSDDGQKHIRDMVRAKGIPKQQLFHTQQLVKEILKSVQEKDDRCTYEATLDMWKTKYPCLERLNLPGTKALFIHPSESETIAINTIKERDISSQEDFLVAFETAFDKQLGAGPQATLQKAIEKLESL